MLFNFLWIDVHLFPARHLCRGPCAWKLIFCVLTLMFFLWNIFSGRPGEYRSRTVFVHTARRWANEINVVLKQVDLLWKSCRKTSQRCLGVHINPFRTLNILVVPRKLARCICQYSFLIVWFYCWWNYICVLNLLIITTRLTFSCVSFSVIVSSLNVPRDCCRTVDQFQTSKNKRKNSIIL